MKEYADIIAIKNIASDYYRNGDFYCSEAIVKAIFYGEAEPANQWIYKGHWGYNPSVIGYPYNPTKAKQLLQELMGLHQ